MNYLLDTSIVLDYGNRLGDLIGAGDKIFLTDIVLQELDGHKNDENKEKGYNAREFFRKMGNAENKKSEFKTIEGDFATCYDIDGVEVTVIVRNRYKTRDINDSKIIEIAKDYGFTLLTRDMAQSVRAKAVNAEARVITEDFKLEVSDEKAEEMLNAIMNSDCPIKKQIKEFCDACDEKGGFEKAKRRLIGNAYRLYILGEDVKLRFNNITLSSIKTKNHNDFDDDAVGVSDEEMLTTPGYSHLPGNFYN